MIKKLILLSCLGLVFPACGGSNLSEDFLNTSGSETGALQVMAVQHLQNGDALELSDEGSKWIENDLGYAIELHQALIHFHQLKLVSNGEDPSCVAGLDSTVDLHATHDLLGEDLVAKLLTTQIIPKRAYCQYELTLGTEEGHEHASKFHGDENHDAVDDTPSAEIEDIFLIEGYWEKDGETEPFTFSASGALVLKGSFRTQENGSVIDHPLHFHDGDLAELVWGIKYDSLFDGVEFKTQSPEEQQEQQERVLENLSHAVHQHTGEHL